MKTNAVRLLDAAGIGYELCSYDWDEDSLDALSVAQKLDIEAERMFKTLVLTGTQLRHFVAVLPGNAQLNLKTAARISGNKSCAMLPLKQLRQVTGYVHGGCSPLGMKKALPTWIDERALAHEHISVSGGKRGLQIILNPRDLAAAAAAQFAAFE